MDKGSNIENADAPSSSTFYKVEVKTPKYINTELSNSMQFKMKLRSHIDPTYIAISDDKLVAYASNATYSIDLKSFLTYGLPHLLAFKSTTVTTPVDYTISSIGIFTITQASMNAALLANNYMNSQQFSIQVSNPCSAHILTISFQLTILKSGTTWQFTDNQSVKCLVSVACVVDLTN